jgi:hypothetical protein
MKNVLETETFTIMYKSAVEEGRQSSVVIVIVIVIVVIIRGALLDACV